MMGSSYLYTYCFVLTFLLPEIFFFVSVFFSSHKLAWLAMYLFQTLVSPNASLVVNRQTQSGLQPPSPPQARGLLLGSLKKQSSLQLQKLTGKAGRKVQSQLSISLKNQIKEERNCSENCLYCILCIESMGLWTDQQSPALLGTLVMLDAHSCDWQRDS